MAQNPIFGEVYSHTSPLFYAYLWLREDGTPYYAGKGQRDRAFNSRGHTVHRPQSRDRIAIFPRASEQEAFATEMELIRNWGRLDLGTGCLRNRTNGGDQPPDCTGRRHLPESKLKMSLNRRGGSRPDTVELNKLRWSDPIKRAAMCAAMRVMKHAKRVAKTTGLKRSTEFREQCAARMTGHKISEETRRNMSNAQRARQARKEKEPNG
jgi:hypothetical protein